MGGIGLGFNVTRVIFIFVHALRYFGVHSARSRAPDSAAPRPPRTPAAFRAECLSPVTRRPQAAIAGFEFYETWTDWQQPLGKLDLVAVPGRQDTAQNWGLMLFDEHRFLFNNVRTPSSEP